MVILLLLAKIFFVCALILSIAGLIFIILLATLIGEFKQGEKLDAKQTLDENNKNRGTQLVLAHCTHNCYSNLRGGEGVLGEEAKNMELSVGVGESLGSTVGRE